MARFGVLRSTALLAAIFLSCSLLVEARRSSSLCGCLGEGKDVCSCDCKASGKMVKSADFGKSIVRTSAPIINRAAEMRKQVAVRSEEAPFGHRRCGCGGAKAHRKQAKVEDNGLPTAEDILSLDSSVQIVPYFKPVGDLCHPVKPKTQVCARTTVLPAHPGPLRCPACNVHVHRRVKPSTNSAIKSTSTTRSGCSPYLNIPSTLYQSSQHYSHDSKQSGELCHSCSMKKSAPSVKTVVVQPTSKNLPVSGGISYSKENDYSRVNVQYSVSGTTANIDCSSGVASAGVSGSFGGDLEYAEEDCALPFEEQEKIYNGVQGAPAIAADPVSVAIAYKKRLEAMNPIYHFQKKTSPIPEERLCYGHTSIPADGSVKQEAGRNVAEEKLQIIEKPIIELRCDEPVVQTKTYEFEDTAEEEIPPIEVFEEETKAVQGGAGSAGTYITYSDLGFKPIAPSSNQFINSQTKIECATKSDTATSYRKSEDTEDGLPCGPLGRPVPGYRPGSVIVQDREVNSYDGNARSEDETATESEDNVSFESDDDSTSSETEVSRSSVKTTGLLSKLWKQKSDYRGISCD